MRRRAFIQSVLAAVGLSFFAHRLTVPEDAPKFYLPPHREGDMLIATIGDGEPKGWTEISEWKQVSAEEPQGRTVRRYWKLSELDEQGD